MITDDSRVVRRAAGSTLSAEYDVLESSTGFEALNILEADDSIRALFLDLWMQGMDGFEVLEKIRSSEKPYLRDLPVVIITGDGEDENIRERALSAGASDFVGKPFSASKLKQCLETLLNNPDQTAAGASLDATAEIQSVSHSDPRRASRMGQLASGGEALMQRCRDRRQSFSVLKLRIERAGALYYKTGDEFARQVLREIGQKITHESRRKDLLVRLTVSDFVVVMPSTSAVEAGEVAKRILRAVRHHVIEYEGSRFHLSMSGGLATPRLSPQADFQSVLETATARLERAISEGGSQNIASDVSTDELRRDEQVSLDSAADQLKKGDTASVQSSVIVLLRKVFPLLVFVNARLKLDIDDALKKIHSAIRPE